MSVTEAPYRWTARRDKAVGIAAVIAGSRSFAAIGLWAADAGPDALAVLGAARGPAEESTFRRAFALVSPDALDRVLGAWLWTRAVRAGGRLVIAVDGKTVCGAKNKDEKAPLDQRRDSRCEACLGGRTSPTGVPPPSAATSASTEPPDSLPGRPWG
jgi:DDE_Tnp_1-associated